MLCPSEVPGQLGSELVEKGGSGLLWQHLDDGPHQGFPLQQPQRILSTSYQLDVLEQAGPIRPKMGRQEQGDELVRGLDKERLDAGKAGEALDI